MVDQHDAPEGGGKAFWKDGRRTTENGCRSAVEPCLWQQSSPNTLCTACTEAAALARFSADRADAAVPVAWRYRDEIRDRWMFTDQKPADAAGWGIVEPLYAAPTPPTPDPWKEDPAITLVRQRDEAEAVLLGLGWHKPMGGKWTPPTPVGLVDAVRADTVLRKLYDATVAPAPWPKGSTPIADFEDAAVGFVRAALSGQQPAPVGAGAGIGDVLDRNVWPEVPLRSHYDTTTEWVAAIHDLCRTKFPQGFPSELVELVVEEGDDSARLAQQTAPAGTGTDGWQDISTAPLDGAKFDAWCVEPDTGGGGCRIPNVMMRGDQTGYGYLMFDQDGCARWVYLAKGDNVAAPWRMIAWRPLPEPPSAALDGGSRDGEGR